MTNGINRQNALDTGGFESEPGKISQMVNSDGWRFYKAGLNKIIKEVTDVCVDPATPLENVKELRGQIYGMKLLLNIAEEINTGYIRGMMDKENPDKEEEKVKVVGIEPS